MYFFLDGIKVDWTDTQQRSVCVNMENQGVIWCVKVTGSLDPTFYRILVVLVSIISELLLYAVTFTLGDGSLTL